MSQPGDHERLHSYFTDRMDRFMKEYAPTDSYQRHGFRIALDSIVFTAMEIAQKPFAYELQAYRDQNLAMGALTPLTPASFVKPKA